MEMPCTVASRPAPVYTQPSVPRALEVASFIECRWPLAPSTAEGYKDIALLPCHYNNPARRDSLTGNPGRTIIGLVRVGGIKAIWWLHT
jgi:hypothetical protein